MTICATKAIALSVGHSATAIKTTKASIIASIVGVGGRMRRTEP